MRVFFDTNILLYLFDADDADKKERASTWKHQQAGITEHPGASGVLRSRDEKAFSSSGT